MTAGSTQKHLNLIFIQEKESSSENGLGKLSKSFKEVGSVVDIDWNHPNISEVREILVVKVGGTPKKSLRHTDSKLGVPK
jgi:hypothetical protein